MGTEGPDPRWPFVSSSQLPALSKSPSCWRVPSILSLWVRSSSRYSPLSPVFLHHIRHPVGIEFIGVHPVRCLAIGGHHLRVLVHVHLRVRVRVRGHVHVPKNVRVRGRFRVLGCGCVHGSRRGGVGEDHERGRVQEHWHWY